MQYQILSKIASIVNHYGSQRTRTSVSEGLAGFASTMVPVLGIVGSFLPIVSQSKCQNLEDRID